MRFAESGKKKAITFSYDDGITQDIRLIELLNRYGLKCTFNLNSGLLGKPGILWREEQHISHYKIHPDDVKSVYEGHEVAVHTLTHPSLPGKDEEFIIRQVEDDRVALSELVGYEVVGMAYPCGPNDDRCASIIKEHTGVKYVRTVACTGNFEPQTYLHRFNPTAFHLDFENLHALADRFLSMNAETPQIFYIWGHSFEMDYRPDYWVQMEEFCKKISGYKDVFYGTNAEILL